MDLRNTQIKDTYGNILTTGTVAGAPTIGTIQNGQGTNVTTLTLDGDLTADNVTATVLTGTLSTAAQTSITSVGTLTGLSVNGTTALQGAVTVNESGANVDFRVEGDTDANLLFVDASTDRVGIGTNTPAERLDVQGGVIRTYQLGLSALKTYTKRVGFEFSSYQSASASPFTKTTDLVANADSGASSEMRILTAESGGNPAERLRIDSSGNVGIGTSSPATPLHVVGQVRVVGASSSGRIDIYGATSATDGAFSLNTLATRSFTIKDEYAATERLRIASDGKVGIGTNSPATRLDVQAVSGAVFRAKVDSDLSNIAVIAGATKGVRIGANTTGGFMEGVDNTGVASFQPLTLGGSDIRFSISGVSLEKMRITSAGNVGIGTSTPASLLDVAGDLTIADKIIHSGDTNTAIRFPAADTVTVETAGSERLRITSAGNVKIGGSADRATTEGSAQLVLFNGTAPVGTLANGVSFYSASGEANVMDAAGNATLLSPHDKDTNEWIFRSKHTPTGKVLKIDVERMLRFINDHFGLDMIEEFTEA